MDTSPDLSRPYTLWSGLIGGMFLSMAYFGCDQSQVQRYLSGRTLTESRLSLLFNAFLKVPMQFLILLTGVLVFVFFHFHATPLLWNRAELARLEAEADPSALAPRAGRGRGGAPRAAPGGRGLRRGPARRGRRGGGARGAISPRSAGSRRRRPRCGASPSEVAGAPVSDVNYIFPSYVVVAAARGPRRPRHRRDLRRRDVDARRRVQLARHRHDGGLLPALRPPGRRRPRTTSSSPASSPRSGASSPSAVALEAGRLGSAIEVVNRFGSYFYGSILGVFGLAVLTPRATARGAFYGLFAGMAAVFLVSSLTARRVPLVQRRRRGDGLRGRPR